MIEAAGGQPARVKRDGYDDGASQCVALRPERPPKQIAEWPRQIRSAFIFEAHDGSRYGSVVREGRSPLGGLARCRNDGARARSTKRQKQPDGLVARSTAWRGECGSGELKGKRQSCGHAQPIGAP